MMKARYFEQAGEGGRDYEGLQQPSAPILAAGRPQLSALTRLVQEPKPDLEARRIARVASSAGSAWICAASDTCAVVSLAAVLADIERDRWLSAEAVVDHGLVSRNVEKNTELRGGLMRLMVLDPFDAVS
jgi:hypothetical protein